MNVKVEANCSKSIASSGSCCRSGESRDDESVCIDPGGGTLDVDERFDCGPEGANLSRHELQITGDWPTGVLTSLS